MSGEGPAFVPGAVPLRAGRRAGARGGIDSGPVTGPRMTGSPGRDGCPEVPELVVGAAPALDRTTLGGVDVADAVQPVSKTASRTNAAVLGLDGRAGRGPPRGRRPCCPPVRALTRCTCPILLPVL